MLRTMFNTLVGKKICMMGFAFKANTSDTRESPAIYVAKRLLEEMAELIITDPEALRSAEADMKEIGGNIRFVDDPYEAVQGCHAVCVMTEWELYSLLDYERIYKSMDKPAMIYDGRNILDHQKLFDIGFNVFPIGKPALRGER